MRRLPVIFLLCLSCIALSRAVLAQQDGTPPESRDTQATVTRILDDKVVDGNRQMRFEAQDAGGASYEVDTSSSYTEGLRYDVRPGDRVLLVLLPNEGGGYDAQLADVIRTRGLLMIVALFALLTVAVGLMRGFTSLVGLAVTIGILFGLVLPRILSGGDPVLTTALGGAGILAVNMHLSHGFSRRTFVAFLSTVLSLGLAVVFARLFTAWGRLSGMGSEEAAFLSWQMGAGWDAHGILLAGMILGAVGVLDDIAVTQTEAVAEIAQANPSLSPRELYVRAMRVGRHHIASTVNTLVLAYAGASLPLLLLFLNSSVSYSLFANTEVVAEQVVQTLAGTAALVLSVPISTFLASRLAASNDGVHKELDGHRHAG